MSLHARSAAGLAAAAFALFGSAAVAQVSGLSAYSAAPTVARYGPSAFGATPGGPSGSVVVQRARARIAAGDFASAQRILANDVLGAPESEAIYLSAVARSGLGDLEGARSSFAQALALDSSHVGARVGLALTDIRLGRHDEAAASLAELEVQRSQCRRTCAEALALERGTRVVAHFLETPRPL